MPINTTNSRVHGMADSPPAALIEDPESPRRRGQSLAQSAGTEDGAEDVLLLLLLLTAVAAWAMTAHRHRLLQQQRQQRQGRPTFIYERRVFCLAALPPGNAERLFRFTEQELYHLLPLLSLEEVPWRSRLSPTPEAALCVVCARLAYPGRWLSLCSIFGRSEAWLSTVFNDTVLFLAGRFGPLLWWHHQLTYCRLKEFTAGVEGLCGVMGVWGFVDGTFRSHCRPEGNVAQRAVYSGHKRQHGINWQPSVHQMAWSVRLLDRLRTQQTTGRCGGGLAVMKLSAK